MKTKLVLFAAAMLTGCAARVVVSKVPASGPKSNMQGVFYALPRTVVQVELPVTRADATPGLFVDYLPLFFPSTFLLGDYVKAKTRGFSLKAAKLTTTGEPDPGEVYFVRLTGGFLTDRTAALDFVENGAVTGVQSSADSVALEVALSAVSGAVALLKPSLFGFAGKPESAAPCPEGTPKVCAAIEKENDLILNLHLLPKDARVALEEKFDGNAFANAKSIYNRISTLITARNQVLKLQGVSDTEARIAEYDKLIDADLQLYFTGVRQSTPWPGKFEFRPAQADDKPELLVFSKDKGICVKADLRGSPPPPRPLLQADCTKPEGQLVTLAFGVEPGQIYDSIQSSFSQTGERSFFYRYPARTKVELKVAGETGDETRLMIAQFGRVASLPASSNGRSLNYSLKMFEATGALKNFTLASKSAIQKANVDSAFASANALNDARLKAEDELVALEREAKIMKARKEIFDACKAMNKACGGFEPPPPPGQ